ncbi:response regulator [Spelaeicoccus albus]|uniref:Transcriptional regulatory protein n=1 Tax=Spelaeicoccus albus TaxID=1280376 RepID=A0A7Z0A8N2_9MICO|nr:response regulator [Spelaeicoccus albus]NYI66392.1 response regulator of citrate/malate metabolism [Spelaeicoccus albus]
MADTDPVRVLVVEDEEIPAAAHAEYVRRLPGFAMAGDCRTASRALEVLTDHETGSAIDLVLLDLNLPDMHGLELCRRLRAADCSVDVIAVTAARDLSIVQSAMTAGIVQYLIKPFTFPAFREKLASYAEYRSSLPDGGNLTQSEVDRALGKLRAPGGATLDKGLARETLAAIIDALRDRTAAACADGRSGQSPSTASGAALGAVSATEMAAIVGCSRVTARRYLERLAESGRVVRSGRYGSAGRPELEYSLNEA